MSKEENRTNLLKFSNPSGAGHGEDETPSKNTYRFLFKGGEEKKLTGYLILTHAFLAISEGPGEITFVAPLDTILYCEQCVTYH